MFIFIYVSKRNSDEEYQLILLSHLGGGKKHKYRMEGILSCFGLKWDGQLSKGIQLPNNLCDFSIFVRFVWNPFW